MQAAHRSSFAVLCGLALLSSCSLETWWNDDPAVWVEQPLRFQASGVAAVSVTTHNGSITAQGRPDGDDVVHVRARKKAGGSTEEDARAALAAVRVVRKIENERLVIGWEWLRKPERNWRVQVSVEIDQPGMVGLEAVTHNGRIRAQQIAAGVSARTHNGSVTVADCAGEMVAVSYNGRIKVGADTNRVELETHNGAIDASLAGQGPLEGRIETHNGSVKLALGDDHSTRLVCTTDNGRVSAHRPLDNLLAKRHVLIGDLGQATTKLEVESHNGSITVR